MNETSMAIMREDFVDFFAPIRAKKLAEDFEKNYQQKLAMGYYAEEAVAEREKKAEEARLKKLEEDRIKKEQEEAEEAEEQSKPKKK